MSPPEPPGDNAWATVPEMVDPPTAADSSVRIGAWSGPRNISTALLRSWGNRPDTAVFDEPLYAHYLQHTGIAHPMADEVIAHHETDWRSVVAHLTGPVPGGRRIWYQKHMTQHLLDHIDRAWILLLRNFLLIRDPIEVVASFSHHYATPSPADTGLPQQVALFAWLRDNSRAPPPIIDARDVLTDPRAALTLLCDALDVPFDGAMLSWPAGRRDTDGVWAPAWYGRVEQSTGFEPYRPPTDRLAPVLAEVAEQCHPLYAELHARRLIPRGRDAADRR